MLLDWLPSVTLKELAVSARNAATLGKIKCAGAEPEVIVEELPEFAADLQRVPAAQAARTVGGRRMSCRRAPRERSTVRRS